MCRMKKYMEKLKSVFFLIFYPTFPFLTHFSRAVCRRRRSSWKKSPPHSFFYFIYLNFLLCGCTYVQKLTFLPISYLAEAGVGWEFPFHQMLNIIFGLHASSALLSIVWDLIPPFLPSSHHPFAFCLYTHTIH